MPEIVIALPPTLDDTSDFAHHLRGESFSEDAFIAWLKQRGFARNVTGTPEDLDPVIRANPTAPMWTATRVRAEIPVAPVVLRPVDEAAQASAPAATAATARRAKRSKEEINAAIKAAREHYLSLAVPEAASNPYRKASPEGKAWESWLAADAEAKRIAAKG